MVNKKTRAKIIRNYTNLRFPGSYQGVSTFRQSLKDNLKSVNPQCLKKGFNRLFKKGMPTFSIMRVDRDKSLNLLANNYFANKGILLLVRRSIHHMGFMESIIRNVKKSS